MSRRRSLDCSHTVEELNDWKWDLYQQYAQTGNRRFRTKAYVLLAIQERLMKRQHDHQRLMDDLSIKRGRWM